MAHTPFPWLSRPTRRRTSKPDFVDVVSADGYAVANYVSPADGALIAAVPRLVDACYSAVGALKTLEAGHPWAAGVREEIMAALREALPPDGLTSP
jgi:hypothetical protein